MGLVRFALDGSFDSATYIFLKKKMKKNKTNSKWALSQTFGR